MMVSLLVNSTSTNAAASRMKNRTRACRGAISPAASGRSKVRSTCGSRLRSAKSLMMQPAVRMMMTPAVKINRFLNDGKPPAANHRPHQVGHSKRAMPMGRSRSEEHTSELQSRGHLVCRLLLEKKNKNGQELDRQQ